MEGPLQVPSGPVAGLCEPPLGVAAALGHVGLPPCCWVALGLSDSTDRAGCEGLP